MQVENRVAAVTGGSAGIGRAIAEAFLKEGAKVTIMARTVEKANKMLEEVGAGDKLIIPKGAWHAEGEVTERVVYIVTLPEPIPFDVALHLHEPRGAWPPEA